MDTTFVVTVGLAYETGVWQSKSIFIEAEDVSEACEKAFRYYDTCLQTVHSWIIYCDWGD
jgi:hypothetical protein